MPDESAGGVQWRARPGLNVAAESDLEAVQRCFDLDVGGVVDQEVQLRAPEDLPALRYNLLLGWPGHSSAARAALLSRTISAGLQDRPIIDVNSWRSCAGWLEHTAHRPDGHLRAAPGTMCR